MDLNNKPDVPSDLQAVPMSVNMADGVHVLPVNVFFKTLLNNSYSHHKGELCKFTWNCNCN